MKSKTEKIKVPISSLIDVVFLLVMFFVVTSVISKSPEIPANLTEAENMKSNANLHNSINITLQKDGATFVDGVLVNPSTERFTNILRNSVNKRGTSLRAVIKADKNCSHKAIDKVLNQLKKSGIRLISITAELTE